jgi:hypothetical protein
MRVSAGRWQYFERTRIVAFFGTDRHQSRDLAPGPSFVSGSGGESSVNDLPPWKRAKFVPATRVHVFELGDRAALFDERNQKLQELNDTAVGIWKLFEAGMTCAEVAEALEEAGAPPENAQTFPIVAAFDWLQLGLIVPEEVETLRRSKPARALAVVVDGRAYELRVYGEPQAHDVIGLLEHFAGEASQAALIDVVGIWGHNFVFDDGQAKGMFEPRQTPPRVKAIIGGDPEIARQAGFLVHGALLSANGKRVFLTGEPGAGKTTLSLALASAGFAFGGDDVARVHADGTVTGVPFAAAAKPGAWPLLKAYVPELESLPILERAGGVLVRYVLPKQLDALGPLPIDITIALQRGEEEGARLEPVNPLDALVAFYESAWSGGRRSAEAETLLAVARRFSHARHYRLIYGDLAEAVTAIQDLVSA